MRLWFNLNLNRGGLLVAAFCILSLCACTSKRSELSGKPVLRVDGHELSAQEFADRLAGKLREYDALGAKDPRIVARAKNEVTRDFIIKSLAEDWAKSNGVFVRKEDLDQEIVQIQKGYPDSLTFERALAEQNLSFKAWREALSSSLLEKLVIKKLNERLAPPTDEELRAYYAKNKDSFERPEQVHLRQVLLASESDARAIESELKKGRALSELAEKFSISPEARKKGDLGWLERGSNEVLDTAFNMRPGQRSPVLKSPYGYHIFEVIAKRPARTLPFEDVKEKIRLQITSNREQASYSSWLESQLRRARILKDEELIKNISIRTKGN